MRTRRLPRFPRDLVETTRLPAARLAPVRRALLAACGALLAALLAAPAPALAQSADGRVRAMVRQAVDDYQNVEVESAMNRLRLALRACGSNNCSPRRLAEVHMTMGVVAVGGLNDNTTGIDAFVQALQVDPNAEPDPQLVTPEVTAAFNQARRRAGSGGNTGNTGNTGSTGSTGSTGTTGTTGRNPGNPGSTGGAEGALRHTPWPEQLENTPLPVFVEPENGLAATHYVAHYRGLGMSGYSTVELARIGAGFGGEIPCGQVIQPYVEYYVTATDDSGNVVASVTTPQAPQRVRVVTVRTQQSPALPGRMPPAQCGEDCPPGMTGPQCRHGGAGGGERGSRQLGDPCESNNQCAVGMHCEGGACASGEREASTPGAPDRQYRFAFNIGAGGGFAYVSGSPCMQGAMNDATASGFITCSASRDMMASIQPYAEWGDYSNDMMLNPTCGPSTDASNTYLCVTGINGFAPSFFLYANALVRLFDRLAVGVSMRFQLDYATRPRAMMGSSAAAPLVQDPDAQCEMNGMPTSSCNQFGQSVYRSTVARYTLAPFLFSGRVYYAVTSGGWARNGITVAPFVGGGVGQIQAHPGVNNGTGITPHIPSGLGNIHAGARFEYGFANFVHVGADLTLNFMVPQFLFVIDAQATVGMHF